MKLIFMLVFLLISNICVSTADEDDDYDEGDEIENEPEKFSIPVSIKEVIHHSFNGTYDVCGNETKKSTCCVCEKNVLNCNPYETHAQEHRPHYSRLPAHMRCPLLRNLNINITQENYVLKAANFNHNNIEKLLKDKILPGNEHTVETLKFDGNQMSDIENGTFDKFLSLKNLDLSHNNLNNISAAIFTKQLGSTLVKLDLSYNDLTPTSVDFTNLVKLEELYLTNNNFNIKSKNSTFIFPKSLSNLKILIMESCGIFDFDDDTFVHLINLEKLNLNDNLPLSTISKAFNALFNLKHLDLGKTLIHSLNKTSFINNTKLEHFEMTSSNLHRIDDCTFCNKPNLKIVILHQNEFLSCIHENAFGNVLNGTSPPLESFSIESCNLSIIPENLLDWYTVKEFALGKNPFMCNCSMAWLINDILSPTHSMNMKEYGEPQIWGYHPDEIATIHFKCHRPAPLKNIPFIHLSEKFCKNQVKKHLDECKNEFSWTLLLHNFSVVFGAFIFGIFVIPVCRYLLRLQKRRTAFSYNVEEDKMEEDFDDDKSRVSKV